MTISIDQIPISKFSALTRLSVKALRLYDQRGLFEPSFRNPINNYRLYTIDQLGTAIKIKLLASIGFGIDEMKEILDAMHDENTKFLSSLFAKKHSEIQGEIIRLQRLEEIISSHKPMELLYMKCSDPVIKHIPKIRILGKREKGQYSSIIPRMIGELMNEINRPENQRNMVKMTGPIMFLTHDEEYKEDNEDIEMAIPIAGKIIIMDETLELHNLDETEMITVIFTGPYREIENAYTKAMHYAHENNLIIGKPIREIYLNDPNSVNEEHLMTEVQIPIVEGSS